MVCSCVVPSKRVLQQVICHSCVIETMFSSEKWQIASLSCYLCLRPEICLVLVRVLIPIVLTTLKHSIGYMESFVSIFVVCVERQLHIPVGSSCWNLSNKSSLITAMFFAIFQFWCNSHLQVVIATKKSKETYGQTHGIINSSQT